MLIQEPKKSEDQTEEQVDRDEQKFIHEFQELGYSRDENEIDWYLAEQ